MVLYEMLYYNNYSFFVVYSECDNCGSIYIIFRGNHMGTNLFLFKSPMFIAQTTVLLDFGKVV